MWLGVKNSAGRWSTEVINSVFGSSHFGSRIAVTVRVVEGIVVDVHLSKEFREEITDVPVEKHSVQIAKKV